MFSPKFFPLLINLEYLELTIENHWNLEYDVQYHDMTPEKSHVFEVHGMGQKNHIVLFYYG